MHHIATVLIALILLTGRATSEPVTVLFSWQDDRCARWDIPDAPARFWKDASGTIRMIASAEVARSSMGPDIADLRRHCRVQFEGGGDPDPSGRDDKIWIASLYTPDGRRIEAIGHAEFHGHDHPGVCDAADYMSCWRNALVALRSRDGGDRFFRAREAPIAALPYRYDPAQRRRSGYFNPSNMIERDGFVYVYFFAESYRAQRRGVCVARRPVGADPKSWRFWDGKSFEGQFADAYAQPINTPEDHVCTPLPRLTATLSSVVKQPATGRYLAVSPMTRRDPRGTRRGGMWAMQSTDLIHWTNPVLLTELPLLWARDCHQDHVHAYPSLVDPESPDRNFATVDDRFLLTFARMKLDSRCKTGPERDLVAIEVNWPESPGSVPVPRAQPRVQSDPLR